jgi:hypothetical protein
VHETGDRKLTGKSKRYVLGVNLIKCDKTLTFQNCLTVRSHSKAGYTPLALAYNPMELKVEPYY